MNWREYDIWLLSLTLWREARGEGREGMMAVAHVIRNRVGKGWGSWQKVMLGKNQFTSMSVKGDEGLTAWPRFPDTSYDSAMEVARGVYEGAIKDSTGGALYYWNRSASDAGGWFDRNVAKNSKEHPMVATIGRHEFFA